MESKRSRLLFSNRAIFSVILNTLFCLHYVSGNAQILRTNFPNGTSNPLYPNELSVQLRMLGGNATTDGERVCTGFTLAAGDQFWIKQIKGIVKQTNIAMNLYGCNYVPINACSCPLANMTLISSWVRYTPAIRFNSTLNTIGFSVGQNSEVKLLLIEITYAKSTSTPDVSNGFDIQITRTKPLAYAAMYTAMASGTISPSTTNYTLDACITIPSRQPNPIRTLAYRPSTGKYGRLVSVYIRNNTTGIITELGRANPQFPTAYYVTANSYALNAGDTIMIRCVFNRTDVVSQAYTELCMMNILWITRNSSPLKSIASFLRGNCTLSQSALFPSNSATLLPNNAILNLHALYGNQTGIVTIDATRSVNLNLETFKALYP